MARGLRDRRAKIIVTLGPSTDDDRILEPMLRAGMDGCRLNFSFGTPEEHVARIKRIRGLSDQVRCRPIAIIADIPGRKVRVGRLEDGIIHLKTGATVTFTRDIAEREADTLPVDPRFFHDNMARGDQILLANGVVELQVERVEEKRVEARVVYGGDVREGTGVHVPGMLLRGNPITDEDLTFLRLAVEHRVDYVALSYVTNASDIVQVREKLEELGRVIPIIAKIDRPEAFSRLDGILTRSDAVMIRRGDLGAQIEVTRVPLVQKQILRLASQRGVPVIIATQMLGSMIANPRPTRAEASDVSHAIADGADGVLLSTETAIGQYPVESVSMMARIIKETERERFEKTPKYLTETTDAPFADATARIACLAAEQTGARLIACFTESGRTAQLVAKYRPSVPVIAFCSDEGPRRRLAMVWGIRTNRLDVAKNVERMVELVVERLISRGLAQPSDRIVIVFGAPVGVVGKTNSVRLHEI